ncbi:MAG: ATP synthase subunit I [Candidatus Izemoplasmatales bacterium]|nr:ATP synthase subunit I [Candidatus Izemoplasmatales bacterium]
MKKKDLIEKIFLFSWPYAILFSLILYLVTQNIDWVLSFILGTASSLLMNSLNYRLMKNIYKNRPEKIKSRHIIMYFVKFLFFALILFIAYQNPEEWNIYFTFIGLLTFRIISFPVTLIFANKENQEDD